jgi:hypothetical protein
MPKEYRILIRYLSSGIEIELSKKILLFKASYLADVLKFVRYTSFIPLIV